MPAHDQALGCARLTIVRFRTSELAKVLDADHQGPDVVVDGASQDTRTLVPGMLFVPLVAERDGHAFIHQAEERGAAAYLTQRPRRDHLGATALVVNETGTALSVLGTYARSRVAGRVVAITGSVGKTSTKDLCAASFASTWRTHSSAQSFNNEIGVPLTLCNAPDDVEVVVVEMGARGVGHIESLCAVAVPDVGIVTRVGEAHLELFGGVDAVARAKGELIDALPASGLAVLNADDERVLAMRTHTAARVLTYGSTGDVRARDVTLDPMLRPRFMVDTPWGTAHVALDARGMHNVANALAAIGASAALGAGLDAVADALARPALSPLRMQVEQAASGCVVINDAYNANPMSMLAALDALAAMPASRRIAVLGPMAELGTSSEDAHHAVGRHAAASGIEVIAVATSLYGGLSVVDAAAAIDALAELTLGSGDVVLVKASRVSRLERVADAMVHR